MANKTVRWISNVFLLAGVTAVSFSAGSFIAMTVWQKWQNRQFDDQRAVSQPGIQPHIQNGEIVGRLAIPRLKVRAMVREGTGERTLSLALGHIPGTALPGQKGNIGVAGHRDTLFRALRNVAAKDEITFETPHETFVYRVETTQIVKPEEVQVLDPGPTRELTLVTCYPFEYVGSAPDRFIVKAKLISDTAGDTDIHEQPPHIVAVAAAHSKPEIGFDVPEGHSRELVPGKIWFGLSSADAEDRTVDGWVWVMPDRRTIWLRSAVAHRPVIFYDNGVRHELVITSVAGKSAKGYLIPSPDRG
jgi:LPXTG-site transpeptidase (sortase) family protein